MNIATPAVIGFLIVVGMCIAIYTISLCKIAAISDERMKRMMNDEKRNDDTH